MSQGLTAIVEQRVFRIASKRRKTSVDFTDTVVVAEAKNNPVKSRNKSTFIHSYWADCSDEATDNADDDNALELSKLGSWVVDDSLQNNTLMDLSLRVNLENDGISPLFSNLALRERTMLLAWRFYRITMRGLCRNFFRMCHFNINEFCIME